MLFSQTRMHKSLAFDRAWKRACQWTWGKKKKKKKRFLLSRRNIDADSAMTRAALLILYSINLSRIHELVPAWNHSCPWIWRMWEEAFQRYRRIRRGFNASDNEDRKIAMANDGHVDYWRSWDLLDTKIRYKNHRSFRSTSAFNIYFADQFLTTFAANR